MSPLVTYRRLLSMAGPGYVIVAFLGRLPLAMSQLGALIMVSTATGSYTAGGVAAGALAVANALGAPVAGAIADRVGQRPVVLSQSLVAAGALTCLVGLVATDARLVHVVATAALAGLAVPQVGPLARVRWRPMTRKAGTAQPRLIDAAFSYEGAADEASFVLGPALVGAIAVLINPGAAVLIAAGLLAVFGCWFALHPTARIAGSAVPDTAALHRRLITTGLGILAVAQLLIGVVFGATQTGTTALATMDGNPGVAGLVHALLGVGSVIAGLSVAGLPERFGYERRLVIFAGALFVLSAPLLAVGTISALVPVVVALGFAVAPYMITVFTVAERIVPPNRVGTAATLLAGATGIGYALGSALAGGLADFGGHRPAFAVTVAAAALALVLATLVRPRLAIAGRPD
ncbi:MAG TPA: MFS transporter [Jiangellales bacterium]|nr:MFS transporter [Jiangellales bacterium]